MRKLVLTLAGVACLAMSAPGSALAQKPTEPVVKEEQKSIKTKPSARGVEGAGDLDVAKRDRRHDPKTAKTLPGDVQLKPAPQPATLPGDMYDGSRPDPKKLPGDMYDGSKPDPKKLPGDMYQKPEPK